MPAADSEIPLADQPQPAGPPACAKARVSPSSIHSDFIKPLSVLHLGLKCELGSLFFQLFVVEKIQKFIFDYLTPLTPLVCMYFLH